MPPASFVRIAELSAHAGQHVLVRAWVTHLRSSGKIAFAVLRDGTGICQSVFVKNQLPPEVWTRFAELTTETSVEITGEVRAEPRAPGGFEIGVTNLTIFGASPSDYPIQPKEHGIDHLLDNRHLWLRSPRQRAIAVIRNEIEQGIHDFFYERGFLRVDTPILTAAIGERSGLFATEYFEEGNAYLAQTGQLYGEAAAAAYGKIYTFGPTFRAEKSKTRRHLTEFWMVEPEMAYATLDDVMDLAEALIVDVISRVLDKRKAELQTLERDTSKLESVKAPFPRISYDDAVERLKAKGQPFEWGGDLGGTDETVLSQEFDRPVMVHRYPAAVKAFYMKPDPQRPELALGVDVLAPEGYGEIIGGGQRLDDYELLLQRIKDHNLPQEAFEWYLDLRRYGTVPHGGFGMGIERMVTWVCGLEHVRETIPYPRMLYRLYP